MAKLTLRQWRNLREMSREELAYKANVSARTIQNYENDINSLRKASIENIEAIASALSISISDILLLSTSIK